MALAALLTCFGATLSETWAQEQSYYVNINSTNFPDAKFRSFVRANYDGDEDGRLSDEEIWEVTEMRINIPNAASSGGVDITGIEHFKYLEELRCERLGLTKLDVSALPNLWCLWCGYNKLRAIKLPNSLGFLDFPVNKFDEEAMEALIEELPALKR